MTQMSRYDHDWEVYWESLWEMVQVVVVAVAMGDLHPHCGQRPAYSRPWCCSGMVSISGYRAMPLDRERRWFCGWGRSSQVRREERVGLWHPNNWASGHLVQP